MLPLLALLSLIASLPAVAGDRVDFDIAAQSADKGLIKFARQARLSVLLPTERISQFNTRALHGKHDIDEALGILLNGSGLSGELSAAGLITIKVNKQGEQTVADSNKHRWFSGAVSSLAAVLGVSGTTTVHAADEPLLEEVVVTAQKREENLMAVPISISVMSAQALSDSGAKNLTEISGFIPGVNFSGNPGYNITPIAIRGVAGTGNALGDEPVAVYIDGVFQQAQTVAATDLVDIRTIEIVRGPQGTLQGRNATAGAILIRTEDPAREFGGFVTASVSNPRGTRTQAAVTGPLGDTLSGRLAVASTSQDGWAHNQFDNNRLGRSSSTTLRGTLLWTPSDTTRARLAVTHYESSDSVAVARWAATTIQPTGTAVPGGTGTPTIALTGAQQDRILEDDQFNLNVTPQSRIRNPQAALEITQDLGSNMQLVSITGYSDFALHGQMDSDGLALTDRQGLNFIENTYETATQELRLQSDGLSRGKWLVGAYYSRIDGVMNIDIYNLNFSVPDNRYTAIRAKQVDEALAGFADGTFAFSDQWSITAGVRYTTETKDFSRTANIYSVPSGAIITPVSYAPPSKTWTDTSYRANVTWTPTDRVLAYVSYSTGFKSGGFNFSGNDPAFNPEELKALEVGAKLSLGERVTVTAAVFDDDYSNLQVTSGLASGGTVVTNAADATTKGAEFSLALQASEWLRLDANVAYTDATYDSFPRAPRVDGLGNANASGNKLTRSPKLQYFIQPTFKFALNDGLNLDVQANWRWRDRVYFTATNQEAFSLQGKAYGELGLRAALNFTDAGFTVAAFGRNLNDARVVTNEQINFGYPEASFNMPRNYGIELSKRF